VKLANGVTGFGEAAVATHITGETVEGTEKNLKLAAKVLQGKGIEDYENLLKGFRGPLKKNCAALAAVEMAVLDAFSRSAGMPFWRLFGNTPRRFSTDITVVIGSEKEAAVATADFFRRGFRSFKVKVGRDADLDLKRVVAVKKAAPAQRSLSTRTRGFQRSRPFGF